MMIMVVVLVVVAAAVVVLVVVMVVVGGEQLTYANYMTFHKRLLSILILIQPSESGTNNVSNFAERISRVHDPNFFSHHD